MTALALYLLMVGGDFLEWQVLPNPKEDDMIVIPLPKAEMRWYQMEQEKTT